MTFIPFVILLSTILLIIVFFGAWLHHKTVHENLGLAIGVVAGIILVFELIIFSLHYTDIYDDFQNPVCIEYIGKAPISYIWNQDQYGVYIDEEYYLLERYLRDYENVVKIINASYANDTIPDIDSLSVYEYQYKPFLDFVRPNGHRYVLIGIEDRYVRFGNCKQKIHQLKTQ